MYDDLAHDIAIKQAKDFLCQCYSTALMLFFCFLFLVVVIDRFFAQTNVRRVKRKFGQYFIDITCFSFTDIIKTSLTFEMEHEKCYTRTIANLQRTDKKGPISVSTFRRYQ